MLVTFFPIYTSPLPKKGTKGDVLIFHYMKHMIFLSWEA